MQQILKQHAFTLWLFAAVLLAMLVPGPASKGGFLHPETTTRLGVWVIFLIQGMSLPTRELTAGYKPMRLHVFVLSWNFLWFPVVVGILLILLGPVISEPLQMGYWMLAIVPTTVASAIAFTALAGGSVSHSIFSTVLSNMLAVFIVPIIAVVYLAMETTVRIPLGPLFYQLALVIIVPLLIGQILRGLMPTRVPQIAKRMKWASSVIIIFIVHAAFADSVSAGFLTGLAAGEVAVIIASIILLTGIVAGLVWKSSQFLRISRAERIAAFFCASQKSLATGLPLATSILAVAPETIDRAAVLIPLLCFHPAQLILAGWVSARFAAGRSGE